MTMRSNIPRSEQWHEDKKNYSECNRKRSSGNHAKCSRIRQEKFAAENSK